MKLEAISDRVFLVVITTILIITCFVVLYPLWFVLIASLSDPVLVNSGDVIFWPKKFTLEAYFELTRDSTIIIGYKNSIIYTIIGTSFSVFSTMLGGFALAQPKLYGKNIVLIFLTITMFFNGGIIPTYLVIKKLHMIDTMWALLLPNSIWIWNLFIVKNFYQYSLPFELQEAAVVDGATYTRYYYNIALPLSRAMLSVMMLYYALYYWNMYFQPLLYISDESKYPLQLILRNILLENQLASTLGGVDAETTIAKQRLANLLKFSSVVVGSLPLLLVYPFLQKYFEKGILIGSVKG